MEQAAAQKFLQSWSANFVALVQKLFNNFVVTPSHTHHNALCHTHMGPFMLQSSHFQQAPSSPPSTATLYTNPYATNITAATFDVT
jgi:hypothetical protein